MENYQGLGLTPEEVETMHRVQEKLAHPHPGPGPTAATLPPELPEGEGFEIEEDPAPARECVPGNPLGKLDGVRHVFRRTTAEGHTICDACGVAL